MNYQESSTTVLNAFPMMLAQDTKGRAAVTIASHMNAMLRKAQNENDLTIFAQTLAQCKSFAQQNNLGGLDRTCAEWNHEGIIKLQSMRSMGNQQSIQNNPQMVANVQQFLQQTRNVINKVGIIDTTEFEIVVNQLDQLETTLRATGMQHFTQEQLQQFLNEILNQRTQIKANYGMIDDILETSHMTR